jgi:hypothetical protein
VIKNMDLCNEIVFTIIYENVAPLEARINGILIDSPPRVGVQTGVKGEEA